MLKDLDKILDYFGELKEADTEGIVPMAGGTASENIFREDSADLNVDKNKAIEAFPENSGMDISKFRPYFNAPICILMT